MAKTIHYSDLPTDRTYEHGLKIEFGINDHTVGAKRVVMGHTIIPAGSRNQRHFHKNNEASFYIVRGRLRLMIGEGDRYWEKEVVPGTFCYVEQGEIHGLINLSDTEDAELIFCYGGISNKEQAGTTHVDSIDVVDAHLAKKGIKLT